MSLEIKYRFLLSSIWSRIQEYNSFKYFIGHPKSTIEQRETSQIYSQRREYLTGHLCDGEIRLRNRLRLASKGASAQKSIKELKKMPNSKKNFAGLNFRNRIGKKILLVMNDFSRRI